MHHDWLPPDDEANNCYVRYYLPTPQEIAAKKQAIRNGELFILPNGQAVTGKLAKRLHRRNRDNTKKRVADVIRAEVAKDKSAEKRCSKCCRLLAVNSFHVNATKHDGLQNICKECKQRAAMRKRRRQRSAVA